MAWSQVAENGDRASWLEDPAHLPTIRSNSRSYSSVTWSQE